MKRIKLHSLTWKFCIYFFCVCILTSTMNVHAVSNQEEHLTEYVEDQRFLDMLGIPVIRSKTVKEMLGQYKFSSRQGHGFAAERGNNLVDNVKGKNAVVIGDNNKKNWADRVIINKDGSTIFIQDKYYDSAKGGINACFDIDGKFRYVDANGNPMQIEVPKDQYTEAVKIMREKIIDGQIPKVTDPEEAENLIRKGALSYNQAKNLAKAGTIESLTYDAATGVISSSAAFGISTVINYAVYRLNGVDRQEAIETAAKEGLVTGMLAFGAHIIASQLSKTGLKDVFKPSSEALIKVLGPKFAKHLLEISGEKVAVEVGETVAEAITRNAAKAFRANVVFDAVAMVVFTVPDAIDLFKGRISQKQFVKNFAVTAISTVAGTAGYFVGSLVTIPGVGTIPSGIIGAVLVGGIASFAADKLMDYITDDDADLMYEFLQNCFAEKCDEYLINEEEANHIVEEFGLMLDEDLFKDMYQSKDRSSFADELLTPLFEAEVAKREKIKPPTEEELREELLEELEGVIFIH